MPERDIELFIRDYVNDIKSGSAALFAGAGLSIPAGFVSWKELISDIAYELGLDIEKESDLISLAQYHLNEKGNRHKINQKIITEFAEQAEETENHRIIARLPIASLWTTNYDDLIEKTYARYNRVCDVKTTPESIQRLGGASPLWRWADVAAWLAQQGKIDPRLADNAQCLEYINLALQLRSDRQRQQVEHYCTLLEHAEKQA